MSLPDDHEDVALELRDVIRDRALNKKISYVYIAILFPFSAAMLSIIIYLVGSFFPSYSNIVIVIVSSVSYAIAVLGSAIYMLHSRVARMEIHALTLHNEILKNRDRIDYVYSCVRQKS